MHRQDEILGLITWGELLDTCEANHGNTDSETIWKVYHELLEIKLTDAREILKQVLKYRKDV